MHQSGPSVHRSIKTVLQLEQIFVPSVFPLNAKTSPGISSDFWVKCNVFRISPLHPDKSVWYWEARLYAGAILSLWTVNTWLIPLLLSCTLTIRSFGSQEWSPQACVKDYHTVTDGHEAITQSWLKGKGQIKLLQCHVVKNNLIGSLLGAKINVRDSDKRQLGQTDDSFGLGR